MSEEKKYDVFLSCNEADRDLVTRIACHLDDPATENKTQFNLWYEPWSAIPGRSVLGTAGEGLLASSSFVIFIGAGNRSGLNNSLLNIALQKQAENGQFPVIAVQLPGAPDRAEIDQQLKADYPGMGLDAFLRTNYWADLRQVVGRDGKLDWSVLWLLECGILGQPPGRGRPNTVREEAIEQGISVLLNDKPLLEDNAYLLCDRRPQVRKLGLFVDLTLEAREIKGHQNEVPTSNPTFFFVPGHDDELHYELVNRFITYEIRPPGSEKEYIAPSQIEITFSGVGSKDDMADDLRMSFEETLGFYEEIESAQQLVDLPDLHGPEVVVFTHDLFVNEWTSETLAFLEWYIGEFWQVKMGEDHPRYVIFFNLHYPLDEHEATSAHLLGIFRQLDELGKKYPQSCAILEELKEMSASDIQRWVAANNLRAFADDLNEKIFKNPLNGEFYKTRNFKYIKQFLQHFIQEVRIKGHG